ncbi:hypothetical protein [Dyadobacter luticola]|uniref:Uncharacterized protein n=1 Tax=Dyadobacter luticola TaxID=1979387 RepID=A0A5R9KPI6_9BACT|nr:hypothetical protein [Dyadobacter luticola]TLU98132.1 hypothetical protein FEN17_25475 [Dyadobacter luticola]
MKNQKTTILSLSSESFKHYLLLQYVANSSDPKWRRLNFVSEDMILPEIWIQLHDHAKADVESQGGRLMGYEVVNQKIVRRNGIKTDFWPDNRMWVISKKGL